jgi:hypothetical protein
LTPGGLSIGQVAWRLGVSIHEYREIEASIRWPSFVTWDRICKLYGWAADVLLERVPRAEFPSFCSFRFLTTQADTTGGT